ncbi:MAG TPA: TetR/AcrR family transcriptional regulator [Acidimicrobiales bacterium]|nr:TetR/AcrR family transcriptional regulator [Acidimicrobiales bacterium]
MASDRYGEIVEAATALFSKKGYEATSVRDIADAVQLKPGSLYAHIRSKEDLLAVIIERVTDAFFERAETALADESLSVAERLRAFLLAHLQTIADNLASATVFLHDWEGLDEVRRTQALERRAEYERRLKKLIREGIDNGEFREVDPGMTAKAVLSLGNWTYTWYSPKGRMNIEQVVDAYFDLLLAGLTSGAKPRRRPTNGNGATPRRTRRVAAR